jgi:tRNA(Arg) A34 adenosine deaminase TadA
MKSHEEYISKTYELARSAKGKKNHPFGALLVIDNEVVLTAENTVITDNDVTKHAELNLVSEASQKLNAESLSKSILYTSTEPCAMCTGSIFWAGISTIVYGCSAAKLGQIADGNFVVPSRELLKFGKRKIEVIGPILEYEGADIHQNFWK